MKTCLVRLKSAEDVRQFVRIVSEAPYDVRITEGLRTVDAKSEMEVFSLNLMKPLEVCVAEEDEVFFELLAPYCLKKGGKASLQED